MVYMLEVDPGAQVTLLDAEHDRFEWVTLHEARSKCAPPVVLAGIEAVASVLRERHDF